MADSTTQANTQTPPQEEQSAEIKRKDLDPRFGKQLDNAEKSMAANPTYVVDICMTILSKYPSCAEVRKILHEAQLKKYGKGNPVTAFFASISGMLFKMKVPAMLKKGQAVQVMAEAEKLLCKCPVNVPALSALALAAESLEYWGTAAGAYQVMAVAQPNNTKILLALGNAFVRNKQPDEAMLVCDKILKLEPSNGDAQALARSASVVKTMEKGKWEEEGSAKDKLKDAAATIEREKQTSLVNDEETLNRLVDRLKAQIETDPANVGLYRELCGNLRTLKRFDEALEYVRKARQQPLGKGDTTFEKMEHDFEVAAMDKRIAALAEQAKAEPDNKAVADELAALRKREHELKLANAKDMVERYPNDFNYRFILGSLLFEEGQLDDAIMQFQISQRNPKVRLQSLLGLGRAFIKGRKFDLAVDQLATAKRECKIMNDAKKEIIYELATAYELMGKKDLAIDEYKEIYSIDISYKDVSKKIEDFYSAK